MALLPLLQGSIPASAHLQVMLDRTTTIRASVQDVERTLMISVALVVMVVFLFLRNLRATFIPSIVVPLSIVGTFGVMYLCHYSLDNLSLMALTISTGFVVDDAIVVIENIMRHVEAGMTPMQATLLGASEIGFTVMTISLSLIAVFIPILLMGGIVGRLFHEFAVTLSAAILVSLVVSLTTSPMLCARMLRSENEEKHGRLYPAGASGCSRGLNRRLWALAALCTAAPADHAGDVDGHDCAQRLPVYHRAEGIFPAAGYGAHLRRPGGTAGYFLQRDCTTR